MRAAAARSRSMLGRVTTTGAGSAGIVAIQFAPPAGPGVDRASGRRRGARAERRLSITSRLGDHQRREQPRRLRLCQDRRRPDRQQRHGDHLGRLQLRHRRRQRRRRRRGRCQYVSVSGAGSAGIMVTSATGSNITIRGLVQSATGYEIQASGGARDDQHVSAPAPSAARSCSPAAPTRSTMPACSTRSASSDFGAGNDSFNNNGTVQAMQRPGRLRRPRDVQQ